MMWTQASCAREVHHAGGAEGELIWGDALSADLSAYAGRAQCVYIDPPFGTGDKFNMRMRVGEEGWRTGKPSLLLEAYSDKLSPDAYRAWLRALIARAHELLSPTGAFFLHVDSRASALARMLCDEVFGERNFINEIIWAYQSGGRSVNHFSRKHDNIFFYQKSSALFFDIAKVAVPRKDNRSSHMRRTVDAQGRPCRTICSAGKTYVYYDDDPVYPGDVWTDVSHLQQKDPQRTGYDTQKPQALLDRIIRCCTKPGDLVADLCCGSGTTLVSAAEGNRRYLGLDCGLPAVSASRKRLLGTAMTLRAPTCDARAMLEASITQTIGFQVIHLTSFMREGTDSARITPKTVRLSALDAVDQWSVGYLRGDTFHAFASGARSKKTPAPDFTLELPQYQGATAILVCDIFGQRSLWLAG